MSWSTGVSLSVAYSRRLIDKNICTCHYKFESIILKKLVSNHQVSTICCTFMVAKIGLRNQWTFLYNNENSFEKSFLWHFKYEGITSCNLTIAPALLVTDIHIRNIMGKSPLKFKQIFLIPWQLIPRMVVTHLGA